MRLFTPVMLGSLIASVPLATSPLAAQFEGTVSMKLSNTGNGGDMTVKVVEKGGKQATIVMLPSSAGPMAGMEMRMIYDPQTNTATTLMPLPPGMSQMPALANAKGVKTVVDFSKVSPSDASTNDKVDVRKLGTSEKIAGLDCDDYEITSPKEKPMRACITQSLGRFLYPQRGNGMGGRGGSTPPPWSKAFGDKPGFPLKVWSTDGNVAMEVTSVEKGSVPAGAFEIPDGYVDMSTLFRGRGGR
jgi:hypothetical protein